MNTKTNHGNEVEHRPFTGHEYDVPAYYENDDDDGGVNEYNSDGVLIRHYDFGEI